MNYLEFLGSAGSSSQEPVCPSRPQAPDEVSSRKVENRAQRQQAMSTYEKYGLSMVTSRPVLPAHLKRQKKPVTPTAKDTSSPVASVTVERKRARGFKSGIATDTTARSRATLLHRATIQLESEDLDKEYPVQSISSGESMGALDISQMSSTHYTSYTPTSPPAHARSATVAIRSSRPRPNVAVNGPLTPRSGRARSRNSQRPPPTTSILSSASTVAARPPPSARPLLSQSSMATALIASSNSWDVCTPSASTERRSRSKSKKKRQQLTQESIAALLSSPSVSLPTRRPSVSPQRRSQSAEPSMSLARDRIRANRGAKQKESRHTRRSRSRDNKRMKQQQKKKKRDRKFFPRRKKKDEVSGKTSAKAMLSPAEADMHKKGDSSTSRGRSRNTSAAPTGPPTLERGKVSRTASPSPCDSSTSSDGEDAWDAFTPDPSGVRGSAERESSPLETMTVPVHSTESHSRRASPLACSSSSSVSSFSSTLHRPRPIPVSHKPPPVASEQPLDAASKSEDVSPTSDPSTGHKPLKLPALPAKFALKQTSLAIPEKPEKFKHQRTSSKVIDFRETNTDIANTFGVVLKGRTKSATGEAEAQPPIARSKSVADATGARALKDRSQSAASEADARPRAVFGGTRKIWV